MDDISSVGSPQPCSTSDQLLLSERVDYLGIGSNDGGDGGDDGGDTSDVDAYEENYFSPTPNMSKHSHRWTEELKTIAFGGVPARLLQLVVHV